MNKNKGFTLVEIIVAVMIYAIIAVISYKVVSSLLLTKQVTGDAQKKIGGVSNALSRMSHDWERAIPLIVRDADGNFLPAVAGHSGVFSDFDSQIEFTLNGYVGDDINDSTPPRRVGYRFINDELYYISWPVLNRTQTTRPTVSLLMEDVKDFDVEYLYPDNKWHDSWPIAGQDLSELPRAVRITIVLSSGESAVRIWAAT